MNHTLYFTLLSNLTSIWEAQLILLILLDKSSDSEEIILYFSF